MRIQRTAYKHRPRQYQLRYGNDKYCGIEDLQNLPLNGNFRVHTGRTFGFTLGLTADC